jgi:hypothetical protein
MCVPEVLLFGVLGGEQVCCNSPRLRRKRVPAGYARAVSTVSNLETHIMKILATALLFVLSFNASADAMQYSLCTLNDGKTMADAQAWLDGWRNLVKNDKIDYEIRLLVPHASPEQIGQFFIEGSSPTLSAHATAFEWWYSDEDAAKSNAQLVSTAACGANSIYMTTD